MSVWQWLCAGFTGALGEVPWILPVGAFTVFAFFVMDWITGVWLAANDRKVESLKMRTMMAAKALLYLGILTFGFCLTLAARSWMPFSGTFGLISAIEAASLVENLLKLERYGAKLGPFRGAVVKLGQHFAAGQIGTETPPKETE